MFLANSHHLEALTTALGALKVRNNNKPNNNVRHGNKVYKMVCQSHRSFADNNTNNNNNKNNYTTTKKGRPSMLTIRVLLL